MEKFWFDGTVTTGGVVSTGASKLIVTVNVPVPVFPAASDAVQVTVVVPTEKLEPEDGEQVGPEVTLKLSVAVTVNVVVLPVETKVEVVMLGGTFTTGGVVSAASSKTTVTVNVPVPTFPAVSDAVQVTVVVPIGNKKPVAGEQVSELLITSASPATAHRKKLTL